MGAPLPPKRATKDPLGLPGGSRVRVDFLTFSIFPDLLEVRFEFLSSIAAIFTILELMGRLKGRFRDLPMGALGSPWGKPLGALGET